MSRFPTGYCALHDAEWHACGPAYAGQPACFVLHDPWQITCHMCHAASALLHACYGQAACLNYAQVPRCSLNSSVTLALLATALVRALVRVRVEAPPASQRHAEDPQPCILQVPGKLLSIPFLARDACQGRVHARTQHALHSGPWIPACSTLQLYAIPRHTLQRLAMACLPRLAFCGVQTPGQDVLVAKHCATRHAGGQLYDIMETQHSSSISDAQMRTSECFLRISRTSAAGRQ
jgi:hypothetical protein